MDCGRGIGWEALGEGEMRMRKGWVCVGLQTKLVCDDRRIIVWRTSEKVSKKRYLCAMIRLSSHTNFVCSPTNVWGIVVRSFERICGHGLYIVWDGACGSTDFVCTPPNDGTCDT